MGHRLAASLPPCLGGTAVAAAPAAAAPPDPVIIVAGTFSPAFANEPLAARMRAEGPGVDLELPARHRRHPASARG